MYINPILWLALRFAVLFHSFVSQRRLLFKKRKCYFQVLNGGYGDRVTAPDTVIIFTNGNFNNEGVPEVLGNLREKKVRIVSVGVGSSKDKDFNQEKIDALAIGTGDVYDLAKLKSSVFIDDIAPSTCKMTSCTSGKIKSFFDKFILIQTLTADENADCSNSKALIFLLSEETHLPTETQRHPVNQFFHVIKHKFNGDDAL